MRRLVVGALVALAVAASASADKKPPTPKSQDEITALQAMFNATDLNVQITAAQALLEKFADTEFKAVALEMITDDYNSLGNFEKSVVYGERTLEANPQSFRAMVVLAQQYARNTKDTDFDKDDKLKKSEKYANDAIATTKTAEKLSPTIPDAEWEGEKKFAVSSAHEVLGMVQMVKKKPEAAAAEFQMAIDTGEKPNPATYVRMAEAYNMAGKYDLAIASAEKAMALPSSSNVVKQYAQAQKVRAVQKKAAANPPATTPAATPAPATPPAQ